MGAHQGKEPHHQKSSRHPKHPANQPIIREDDNPKFTIPWDVRGTIMDPAEGEVPTKFNLNHCVEHTGNMAAGILFRCDMQFSVYH